MRVVDYLEFLWLELIYFFGTVIYLFKLDKLNRILNDLKVDNSILLLGYDNGKPIIYFLAFLALFGLGINRIWMKIKYFRYECTERGEVIAIIVTVLVIFTLMILLIIFIDVPILQAIFVAILVGLGYKVLA